jgi:hypothetical protein
VSICSEKPVHHQKIDARPLVGGSRNRCLTTGGVKRDTPLMSVVALRFTESCKPGLGRLGTALPRHPGDAHRAPASRSEHRI